MIDVLLTTTTLVAAAPPNVTVAPATKFVPVIVTLVPPTVEPEFGEIALTVGGATYVKRLLAAFVPAVVVTSTLAVPAEPAGVVAVIVVEWLRHKALHNGQLAGVVEAVRDVSRSCSYHYERENEPLPKSTRRSST